jgi:uncharacterized protein (TIGR00730 family)
MIETVCVYCGSRSGTNPEDEQAAIELGTYLAKLGVRLVYGGGSIGLMGALAKSVLAGGGEVIGIIPQALLDCEVGLVEASELIVTKTMRERKALMDDYSDLFIALPGGFGTLEELMETLTLRQLGYHQKPIILVNLHGYYDPLLQFFSHIVTEGYVGEDHHKLYHVVSRMDDLRSFLQAVQTGYNGQYNFDQSAEIRKKIGP